MGLSILGKDFFSVLDFSTEQVRGLIRNSLNYKSMNDVGAMPKVLEGKTVCQVYEKGSTRTQNAFFNAVEKLGGHIYLITPGTGANFGTKETVKDTGFVLGHMYDAIAYRPIAKPASGSEPAHSADDEILAMMEGSEVPVINGMSDIEHPTQIIADYATIAYHFGSVSNVVGKKVVFVGDYVNNMGHSWLILAAFAGMDLVLCGPKALGGLEAMDKNIMAKCEKLFAQNGGSVSFSDDKIKAAKDADIITTDVWVSLGHPMSEWADAMVKFTPFQVDAKMLNAAKPTVKFMHCLPAFHGMGTKMGDEVAQTYGKEFPQVANGELECTNEVFYSPKWSLQFTEAEFRVWSICAILGAVIGGNAL